jgi:hypothetical protein
MDTQYDITYSIGHHDVGTGKIYFVAEDDLIRISVISDYRKKLWFNELFTLDGAINVYTGLEFYNFCTDEILGLKIWCLHCETVSSVKSIWKCPNCGAGKWDLHLTSIEGGFFKQAYPNLMYEDIEVGKEYPLYPAK